MSRARSTVALLLAVASAGALVAPQAMASGDDQAMALELFDRGRALREGGQYEAALAQFNAAKEGLHTFGVLLNIAECLEKLGRTASAWTTWREAGAVASEARRVDDEELAAARQKALEALLSRLTIVVNPDADSPGLEVRRNGALVPREAWGGAIAVDPGIQIIQVTAPGRVRRRIEQPVAGSGDNRVVIVTALDVAAPPDSPSSPPAKLAQEDLVGANRTGSGQRTAGWILGAAGLAGVSAGIAVALVGQHQHDDAVATDLAGNPAGAQSMESTANTIKTIGYATIGGGGAVLIIGMVLELTAPAPVTANISDLGSLRPWVFANGAGAAFSREWE